MPERNVPLQAPHPPEAAGRLSQLMAPGAENHVEGVAMAATCETPDAGVPLYAALATEANQ